MLDVVSVLLRDLLIDRVPGITDTAQVGFDPPNDDWRQYVNNLTIPGNNRPPALNLYLVEIRENRHLRTNERTRVIQDGIVNDVPAPRRLDCHYLLTAWGQITDLVQEPTKDELPLLYGSAAVLLDFQPLLASDVYPPGALPAGFPPLLADESLPTTVAPMEGFPKYAEFWGTMGNIHPWKPAVYLVVTVPVALFAEVAGPPVTTRFTQYGVTGVPQSAEVLVQIGGRLLNPAGQPVPDAWLRLETAAGTPLQSGRTDVLGRYTFGGLSAGDYRLHASATGLGEQTRDVTVPSATGEYDVKYP